MIGGSEMRCITLCNALVKFSDHKVNLLCSNEHPSENLARHLDPRVTLVEDCLSKPEYIYNSDFMLVVNSDSRDFCTKEYFLGKSVSNSKYELDLSKFPPKMGFLFNYLLSPARTLSFWEEYGKKICLLPTNSKFFNEISSEDKFESVRALPRFILQSPINPEKIPAPKSELPTNPFVFCMIAKHLDGKWNSEIPELISFITGIYKDKVKFILMGVKNSVKEKLKDNPYVELLKEGEKSVGEVLSMSSAYIAYPDYKRSEPLARCNSEAMLAGLPIILLQDRSGNLDQCVMGNNGYLAKDLSAYKAACLKLIENPKLANALGRNSAIYAKEFTDKKITEKFLSIIESL